VVSALHLETGRVSISPRAFPRDADISAQLDVGSVRFGRNVLQDLVAGVTDAASRRRTHRQWGVGVLGSSMWMDDPELLAALHACDNLCVVITKQTAKSLSKPTAQGVKDLAASKGLFQKAFPELHDFIPGGGKPLRVGPGTPNWLDEEPEDETGGIGGVREVGFRRSGDHLVPIVHTKVLLLGQMWWHDEHPAGFVDDLFGFRPERLWIGSANFTRSSREGLEMGLWTSDQRLMEAARQYLLALITLSEPLGEGPDELTRDLSPVEFDDAAFAEYVAGLEGFD
jgi:hypothetical protein